MLLRFLHINVSDTNFTGNYCAVSLKKTYKYIAKKIASHFVSQKTRGSHFICLTVYLWSRKNEDISVSFWLIMGYHLSARIFHWNFFFYKSKCCIFRMKIMASLVCYLSVEEKFMKDYWFFNKYIHFVHVYIYNHFALLCIMNIWIYLFGSLKLCIMCVLHVATWIRT